MIRPHVRRSPVRAPVSGRALLATLFLVLSGLVSAAGTLRAQDAFAVTDVRVFDGTETIPSATVVVRDGRIAAVGPDVEVPEGVEAVDGAGRTLLPGLIDAHTHTFAPEALETALAFGVTTQLDMFSSPDQARTWKAEQSGDGAPVRADIFSAGILATAPGGHGTQYGLRIPTIASPSEAEAFVAGRIEEGSGWLKIIYDDGSVYGLDFPTLDEATVRALIEEAHARDLRAVVHVSSLERAREAVRAGADGLAHVWVDSVPDDAFVREVAEAGAFVIPTLPIRETVAGGSGGAELLEDPALARFLGPRARRNLRQSRPRREALTLDAPLASVGKLEAAGVPILAGTDAPNSGTWYGVSMHRALTLLVRAGLTPAEALAAATSATARAFGLEERGRIAPGLRADLLLVEGDPTAEVEAARDIVAVWKGGRRLDREAVAADVAERLAADTAAAPVPEAAASGDALISDFDAGGPSAAFGVGWSPTTDQMAGGTSMASMEVVEGGAAGTSHALRVTGEIAEGLPYAWGGVMYMPGRQPMTPVDLSAAEGFSLRARGDGGTYRVMLFTRGGGQIPATQSFEAGSEWEEHAFAWSDFGTDGSDVMGIAVVGGPEPGPFELRIDQVRLR